jgi:hypothetical protein
MSDTVSNNDSNDSGSSFADDCASWAPEVGFGTGYVYSEIAGPAVGAGVGGYVEEHWADTCALPGMVTDTFSGGDNNPGSDIAPAD